MANDDQPSTLKANVDSATGAVQGAIGKITGSSADEAQGQVRKDEAEAEHEASHTTAKIPGAAISGSGAAVRDNSDRSQGSWNQTIGSAKEAVGGLVGSQDLKQAGRQQNLDGQQQEAKGQLSDLGSGVANRAQGTIGGAVAGLTGDTEGQEHYDKMRAEGKTQQRGVEHDLQKQAEAEHRDD